MKNEYTIALLAIGIVALGYTQYRTNQEIEKLECDLINAFFAEREYVYPAIREMGFEPNDTAKSVNNPITSNIHYSRGCEE